MESTLDSKAAADEKDSFYKPRPYVHSGDTIREATLNFNGDLVLVVQHPKYEFLNQQQIYDYAISEGLDWNELIEGRNFNSPDGKTTNEVQIKIGEYTLIPGFIDAEGSKSLADFGGRKLTLIKRPIPTKDRKSLEEWVIREGFNKDVKFWEVDYFSSY